jgi:hypothetical protein
MADGKREYTINIKNSKLVFMTTSYRAEKGSVLHAGIYNREFASSVASGAVLMALAITAILRGIAIAPVHYVFAGALFIALFILFRVYVFFESRLQAIIDKSRGELSIYIKGVISRKFSAPLSELAGIRKGYTVIAPENVDGVRVVEKIALQHGTVIPGFGEVKQYHTVNFEFRNGETPMVFSSEDAAQVEEALEIMNRFVGGSIAQED